MENGLLPEPYQWLAAGAFLVAGLLIVGVSYRDLVSMGDGSPSPTGGETQVLVVRGVYAHCRNPSVHGKLAGVLSVGLALNSFSFCCVLIPPILVISLAEKVIRQEPQLVERFGKRYLEYRENVPLFIPRWTPWRSTSGGLS